ncbi:MAG: recombinase family protein [Phycisphaerales bacterium]|nr:MAG: recombinase family protein [Phycisphaerales bacterium]
MSRPIDRSGTTALNASQAPSIGSVPYGFDLADDGATLVPNESEQAVIADIRSMRTAGKKLKQIAKALTERGIPTKTGRSARWSHQAVARILNRTPWTGV